LKKKGKRADLGEMASVLPNTGHFSQINLGIGMYENNLLGVCCRVAKTLVSRALLLARRASFSCAGVRGQA
jgi:hypothetical protein